MTATPVAGRVPLGLRDTRAPGWWGMVLVVLTEGSFFVYLLFSYFYLASQAATWPPPGPPKLELALPATVLLLASSGTMWWGERAIRRDQRGRMRLGLLLTLLLGAAFLAIQVVEYGRKPFGPGTDAYGSLFFTITGFHGAHVAVGLLMNLYLQARAAIGQFGRGRHQAVTNVALYWHFVDAVWVAVFTSLYLAPRF
jgi:heme/copper-type cytochrome/quinol oxidase subunit 3